MLRSFSPFALVLFALYVFTAAPGAGFEDSVFFALSCLNADIAHAPGYPLYALLCYPFAQLPLNPALAAAVFSALCAALACALLAAIIHRLGGDKTTSCIGAMLYGVSAGFWAQANIPEVYTLNVLLFLGALYLALLLRDTPRPRNLLMLIVLCALGLSNHWPLFMLAAAALPAVLWPARQALWAQLCRPPIMLTALCLVIAGLSPYLYLLWRTHHPAAFMGLPFAPDDWSSFWQIISRQVHTASDQQGGTLADKAQFMFFIGRSVLWEQFGPLGGGLAIAGFVWQWRRLSLTLSLALSLMFITATVLLIGLLGFVYDDAQERIFAAYPLLPFAAACIWAALVTVPWQRVGKFILAAAVCFSFAFNFNENDRRHDTWGEDITRAYFAALPAGAWIPAPSQQKFARYLQITENLRPDVIVTPAPNPFAYEMNFTGVAQLYPPNTLEYADEIAAINRYAAAQPLCYNTFVPFAAQWQSAEYLLFSCLTRRATVVLTPPAMTLLKALTGDARAAQAGGRVIEDATRSMLQLRARLALPARLKPLLQAAQQTPAGLLAEVEFLRNAPGLIVSAERAGKYAQTAAQSASALNRRQQARVLSAIGDLYAFVTPRTAQSLLSAKNYHAQAVALTTNSRSPALRQALAFYRREALTAEAQQLIAAHGEALLAPPVVSE